MNNQTKNKVGNIFDMDSMDIVIEIINMNSGGSSNCSFNEEFDCDICQTSLYKQYTITMSCGHTYHRNCILNKIIETESDTCDICIKLNNLKNKTTNCYMCTDNFEFKERNYCIKCTGHICDKCILETCRENMNTDEKCPFCVKKNKEISEPA